MSREIERPTRAQIEAADPSLSLWVGANAGSGKTRVLAQRVARLLLAGTPPERILCLTYTKAAAAEMQNRLFQMLGGWAMAGDDWLAAQLAALEGREAGPPEPARLARARRLFARALETPGGLRIQTIHAFCDALLRRFPLEAGLSPRFEVLDDRQARLLQERIRTRLAVAAETGRDPAFDRIAGRINEGDLDSLVAAVQGKRDGFPPEPLDPRLEAHFGPDAARTEEEVAVDALAELDLPEVTRLAHALAEHGGKADKACAVTLGTIAELAAHDPLKAAKNLSGAYMTGQGEPRSRHNFPVKKLLQACPWADALTDDLIAWAERTRERLRVSEAVERTRDLDAFATHLLAAYETAKRARALLDFDDLIERAHDLLVASDMAAWVLWKLDHGIDHILVDEAQDTAPRQWALIEAIAEEFHAGEGARDVERTVFVVGDEKQSIYSFQGAEPAAFGSTRERMAGRLRGVGRALREPALETSFRSAPGILRFVDAVFDGDEAEGLTLGGQPPAHSAHRVGDGARIDLWPLVTPPEKPEEPAWWEPIDRPPPDDPRTRLAETLAREIRRMLAEDRLPPRDGRDGRRVRPGDVLVLVSRRDRLAATLIRKLKSLGVPVAGADRLSLMAELAVKDLMALVRVALTPGDDLSLAALLRSPLCGWSEEELYDLAHGRGRTWLWSRLMQAEPRTPAAEMLADMADQADYLRPYEFLERALIHHGGRQRLVARLGLEAEDPIDELLAQALAYETREIPSLSGFVHWVEAGEITVKREMEAGRDAVRVMTVHGAKGLEAPVVILPDTMADRSQSPQRQRLHRLGGGNKPPLVVWERSRKRDDAVTRAAGDEADGRGAAEAKRLLYVALTRAEDWLILCGASGQPQKASERWYGMLERGLQRMGGAGERPGPPGLDGPVLRLEDTPVLPAGAAAEDEPAPEQAAPALPAWLRPAPAEARPERARPSGLAEHEAGGGRGLGRAAAMLRGSAVHRLLEELPDRPAEARPALARRLLAAEFAGLDPALAAAALAEAEAVLASPWAAELFGPGSLAEATVALAPRAPGAPPMLGRIDRLVLRPGEVLVVDYKTDAAPPTRAADVPEAYLAQLAAYRAGIAALYPDRRVTAAILWTGTPSLMPLPTHGGAASGA